MSDLAGVVPDSEEAEERAAAYLKDGEVVIGPTDTLYGVLALAESAQAVEKVRKLKQLPPDRPLIVLVPSCGWAQVFCGQPLKEIRLASLWPGPLTLVVQASGNVPLHVTGGGDTVAIRWPESCFAQRVMLRLSKPLVAPSANLSGQPTARTAEEAALAFGELVPLVVKGDDPIEGAPSTIVSVAHGDLRILREGRVPNRSITGLD
jgi:L-threonylcarbamoyladenylate synthase